HTIIAVRTIITTLVVPAITLAHMPFFQSPISPRLLTRISMKISTKGIRTPLATCESRISFNSGSPGISTHPAPTTIRNVYKPQKPRERDHRVSTPDSNPNASHTLYEVASGRMAAESIDAFASPTANSRVANLPANGARASAASAASVISRCPDLYKVAAHATTIKNAITSVTTQPRITSHRDSEKCFSVIPFSTIDACR